MLYQELNNQERKMLSRVLNTKKALEQAQKAHYKAVEQIMGLAEKSGTLEKNGEKVIYKPSNEYITLDTVKLKAEQPELAKQYSKLVERKASVQVLL